MMNPTQPAPEVSIGLLAWNEEESIAATLRSLFHQSLFDELKSRDAHGEVWVVCNGCTDRTPAIAKEVLATILEAPRLRATVSAHVVNLAQRGKPNAWNEFVHRLSAPEARGLFLLDADILISKPHTLSNMYHTLLEDDSTAVVVDEPQKDIAFKNRKSLFDRISLATSRMTQSDAAQLTGQLYCIRAGLARRIYLPRDLIVEDGFIKALICTDCLTSPPDARRVVQAKEAAHIFEAYTSPRSVLRNQKRQMIGQTLLHVLLDQELKRNAPLPDLGGWLREQDERDPAWIRRLVADHLRKTRYFWRLFPGALTFRFKRWAGLRAVDKLKSLPATIAGFGVTLVACWLARRCLARDYRGYWPDTRSPGLERWAARQLTGAKP